MTTLLEALFFLVASMLTVSAIIVALVAVKSLQFEWRRRRWSGRQVFIEDELRARRAKRDYRGDTAA